MVHELLVFIGGRLAGVARRRRGSDTRQVAFRYDDTYASDPYSTPLSLRLPLKDTEHIQRLAQIFLVGADPPPALLAPVIAPHGKDALALESLNGGVSDIESTPACGRWQLTASGSTRSRW